MIGQISGDAKRLSLDLRPGILDDLGLIPAIRWLVDQINKEGIIEARISILKAFSVLYLRRQHAFIQNNPGSHQYARRHSGADCIEVQLVYMMINTLNWKSRITEKELSSMRPTSFHFRISWE
jgi:signal transduction histidine kinase